MSATRCGLAGVLGVILLALAACMNTPAAPPVDRTSPSAPPENAVAAALAPLGLGNVGVETAAPAPLREAARVPTMMPGLTPLASPSPAAAPPPTIAPRPTPAGLPRAGLQSPAATQTPAVTLPTATSAPTLTPILPAGPPPTAAVAANLRGGPGLDYPVLASANQGEILSIVACNADRTWYKLSNGLWIFGDLVQDPPRALQVTDGG